MQTIAGIHYNFSLPESFWPWLQSYSKNAQDLNEFRTERYLGLIRNFQRWSWLLVYLFGASPAVCSTFLKGRTDHGLEPTDSDHSSYHLPYATSLRMGGLGYNSDTQKSLQICYNQLDTYVATLRAAIVQQHPAYSHIPTMIDGEYQQLSDCLLQIENEFYSPIRPKRVARSGEPSLHALALGGIEYIEVRCIDLNPFLPTGIDAPQIRFLDLFLLYCLLKDSPECNYDEQTRLAGNFGRVVTRGREPGLLLDTPEGQLALQDWGQSIMTELDDFAAVLDTLIEPGYREALAIQRQKLSDTELTPSAQVSQRVQQGSFFTAALQQAKTIKSAFLDQPLDPSVRTKFEQEATDSLREQAEIEAGDTVSFEQFLDDFLDQYRLESLHPNPN
jgi:glutamate--cysteine ligase